MAVHVFGQKHFVHLALVIQLSRGGTLESASRLQKLGRAPAAVDRGLDNCGRSLIVLPSIITRNGLSTFALAFAIGQLALGRTLLMLMRLPWTLRLIAHLSHAEHRRLPLHQVAKLYTQGLAN
jgi:hypothetical protein